jgi:hypothetical protein
MQPEALYVPTAHGVHARHSEVAVGDKIDTWLPIPAESPYPSALPAIPPTTVVTYFWSMSMYRIEYLVYGGAKMFPSVTSRVD